MYVILYTLYYMIHNYIIHTYNICTILYVHIRIYIYIHMEMDCLLQV